MNILRLFLTWLCCFASLTVLGQPIQRNRFTVSPDGTPVNGNVLYNLPQATATTYGVVLPDGVTTFIFNGKLSAVGGAGGTNSYFVTAGTNVSSALSVGPTGTTNQISVSPLVLTNGQIGQVSIQGSLVVTNGFTNNGSTLFGVPLEQSYFPQGTFTTFLPSKAGDEGWVIYGDYRNGVSGERYASGFNPGDPGFHSTGYIGLNGDNGIQSIPSGGNAMIAIGQDVSHGIVIYGGVANGNSNNLVFEVYGTTSQSANIPTNSSFPNGKTNLIIDANGDLTSYYGTITAPTVAFANGGSIYTALGGSMTIDPTATSSDNVFVGPNGNAHFAANDLTANGTPGFVGIGTSLTALTASQLTIGTAPYSFWSDISGTAGGTVLSNTGTAVVWAIPGGGGTVIGTNSIALNSITNGTSGYILVYSSGGVLIATNLLNVNFTGGGTGNNFTNATLWGTTTTQGSLTEPAGGVFYPVATGSGLSSTFSGTFPNQIQVISAIGGNTNIFQAGTNVNNVTSTGATGTTNVFSLNSSLTNLVQVTTAGLTATNITNATVTSSLVGANSAGLQQTVTLSGATYNPSTSTLIITASGGGVGTLTNVFTSGATATSIAIGPPNAGNSSATGTANTGLGAGAGAALTTGHDNTFIGNSALALTTTGIENTAIGSGVLQNEATTSSFNTAVGFSAMAYTTGQANTAIGDFALEGAALSNNVAIGNNALQNAVTTSNVAIGYMAGVHVTNGFNNIYIGANVGTLLDLDTNITRIGNTATATTFLSGVLTLVSNENAANFSVTNIGSLVLGSSLPWTITTNGSTNLNPLATVYSLGTNSTIVHSNAYDSHNVLYYGADPTGVADSTAAFNACMAASLTRYIPTGFYSIKGITDTSPSNAVWYGDGVSSQIYISSYVNGTNGFNLTNGQCSMHDLSIFGNNTVAFKTGTPGDTTIGVSWNCLSNGSIRNVTISGFQVGLQVNGIDSINVRPQNGFITGCTVSNCYLGLYLTPTNQAEFVRVENNSFQDCYKDIANDSAANVLIIGNKCFSTGAVLGGFSYWHNPSPSLIAFDGSRGHSLVTGNMFDHSVYGVAIIGANNLWFNGNQLGGNGGLNVTNCTNCIFNNNWFECQFGGGDSGTWVHLSAGISNEFRFNELIPGGGTNITGATTANSFWEGNHLLGGATNSLIAPAGQYNGFDTTGLFWASAGIASMLSNTLAPTAIATFPATTVNWTNPLNANIEVYLNNSGVTGTALKKNGTTIFTSITGDATFHLQPGEYFSETYTIGTPSATYSPY